MLMQFMSDMTQMESNVGWFPVKCEATKLFSGRILKRYKPGQTTAAEAKEMMLQ